jgi:cyclopropane-fatty-acyl-phospholipid synthase
MNAVFRRLLYIAESMTYGVSYGALQTLIRTPEPLDGEATWKLITRELPPLFDWFRLNYPPAFTRRFLLAAKMKKDHVIGISKHYDVSNDFYELFLDKKYMFYTCADFHEDTKTLEEAQTNKANFICDLIDPKPGERILDLGCGWGSMMKRIYEATGDKENLVGYTLSKEQVTYNQEHHGFNVEFRNMITTDYPESHFDKIYSVGSWEAVRPNEIAPIAKKLYAALKPGGRMIKHYFMPPTETIPTGALAAQIFFPGSLTPSYRAHVHAFENAGFKILQRTIHDYRPTLRAWFDNLVANRERAIELVGVRTFNKYLVFFPGSWRFFYDCGVMLVRFVMEKPKEE